MKTVVRNNTAIYGAAKVIVGESRIKVMLKSSPEAEDFDGDQYKFDRDDIPDCIRKSGTYMASISGDGKTLYGLRPLKGVFTVKVKNIASRKDEPPAPKERTGKYGPYLVFTVNLVITEGEYKGMEIPVQFNYKFVETDDELTSIEIGTKKGNPGERLMDFLEIAGVGDVQIPYSDNVLPKVQKALLKAGVEFQVALKDGWADYFMEITEPKASDEDEDHDDRMDDDEDDDQPKAKVGVLKPKVEDDDDLDEAPKPKNGKTTKHPEDKFEDED